MSLRSFAAIFNDVAGVPTANGKRIQCIRAFHECDSGSSNRGGLRFVATGDDEASPSVRHFNRSLL